MEGKAQSMNERSKMKKEREVKTEMIREEGNTMDRNLQALQTNTGPNFLSWWVSWSG